MYRLFFDFSFHPDFQLYLPQALLAQQRSHSWFLLKKASPEVMKNIPIPLRASEKEALAITYSLQPHVLAQKYNPKNLPIEELFKNKSQKKYIQEQIEEKTNTLLSLIAKEALWLTTHCQKEQPIERQLIEVSPKELHPILEFEKTPEGIAYHLFLLVEEKLVPAEHQITLLSQKKSWIVIDQKLTLLEDIPAQLVKPFLGKTSVEIPQRMVQEYFDKFLKEVLQRVEVCSVGFDILTKDSLQGTSLHFVHDFLSGQYKLYVAFDYDGYTFYSNQRRAQQSLLDISPEGDIHIQHFRRNPLEEARKVQILKDLGLQEVEGFFWVDDPYPFATYLHLLSYGEVLEAQELPLAPIEIEGKQTCLQHFDIQLNETTGQQDWFDVDIWITQGDFRLPFASLIKNLRENNPLYPLPDGSWLVIPKEWFARYERLAKFGEEHQGKIRLARSHYALLDTLAEAKPKEWVSGIHYQPSPRLKASLRPYQREGVEWLLEHYHNQMGACLADDMGLGKTLQILAMLIAVHDTYPLKQTDFPTDIFQLGQMQREPLKALIVLPSSLIFNWYEEIKRFTPDLRCTQYIGNDRKTKVRRLLNYDIVLTSYPILTRDIALLEKHPFSFIILDESQRIKNKNSQVFKAIDRLQGTHRFSLSGTPIENSLSDLWAQMQFINPNILGTFAQFSKYFLPEIQKKHNPIALEELKTIINPFLLRRTKEQVLQDLPDMEEQIIYCPMSELQEKWYEQEKSKVRNALLQVAPQGKNIHSLNMLMRLRQISNHPLLADPKSDIPSGKYEEVVSCLEQLLLSAQKALIFSSFTSHLEIYQRWCDEQKIKYALLTGATALPDRKVQVERFQKDKEVPFFFISLKAGEVGLNLTAASYVLLLDPWWNPFAERQAIARAHRLGQEQKVNVIRFVSQHTLEEKIIRLQQHKRELSKHIIEEDTLMKEELLELLE